MRKVWRNSAWVATAAVIATLVGTGAVDVPTPGPYVTPTPTVIVSVTPTPTATPTPTPTATPSGECDRNATTSTLATQVSAATAGQTICLASGSYGTWNGASKSAPGITLTAAEGASVSMGLVFNLSNVQNVTVDGSLMGGSMTIGGANMNGSTTNARNITVRNATFTAEIVIDGPTNSAITLGPGLVLNNLNANSTCSNAPARIWLSYWAASHSGVTITGNTMIGGSKDGFQGAVGVNIIDNHFENISDEGHPCSHTDAIQLVGASGATIEGNTIINTSSGIVDFDDTAGHTIRDNACRSIHRSGGACITLYSDTGSLVEHNTNATGPVLELSKKSGHNNGTGTIFRDNVGSVLIDASTLAVNSNNLFSGASSPNINGTPTFAGGGSLTEWADWCLTGPSGAMTGSTTGGPVGIRCNEED